ncbi:hypothetical protein SLEP1_g22391 [Rubroshorea leprosula]|uniref:Secreted protein n=1 Tax=Rubroshorea leprosula TaxID=152421 RepID=A0AAV5JIE0_9ROSI|nr:hypothetical protein SLEP1_g22391 [Rubroshorea leprosula]
MKMELLLFSLFSRIEHAHVRFFRFILESENDYESWFFCKFAWFCLRYGHVIRVPASGRFINVSTCRHVIDRTGSLVLSY